MKAKEEPRNAGTLNLVMQWNAKVPIPANNRVDDTESPVSTGTKMVAPNMANRCWIPKMVYLGRPNCLASVIPSLEVMVITMYSKLSHLATRLDILGGSDHAEALVKVDSREYHALALDAHHLARLEVGYEEDALAYQFLRVLIESGNT